jgi:hypothetical protein
MPIAAECHSDDHVVEVSFDAEPWFAQASDEQIISLANCGWNGDYPADEVAIFVAGINEAVQRLFTYLELVSHRKDHPGFECSVEVQSAIAWLAQYRPQLAAVIQTPQSPI